MSIHSGSDNYRVVYAEDKLPCCRECIHREVVNLGRGGSGLVCTRRGGVRVSLSGRCALVVDEGTKVK
jgi:hypothetical protein